MLSFIISILEKFFFVFNTDTTITDSKSKIWIEKLNLPFDKISTELDVNEGGYIHLMSNKSDKNVGESYINLVKSELPDYYRRIRNLLDN